MRAKLRTDWSDIVFGLSTCHLGIFLAFSNPFCITQFLQFLHSKYCLYSSSCSSNQSSRLQILLVLNATPKGICKCIDLQCDDWGSKYIWPSVGFEYTLDSMRPFMIHSKVSNTSSCLSLYLTVNLIPGLREFNQSLKRARSSWLPNQGLKQSSRNLDQSGGNTRSFGLS